MSRRPYYKRATHMAQMVHAPVFTPAAHIAAKDTTQGPRTTDRGKVLSIDPQDMPEKLSRIESALDDAKDCSAILPTLDQIEHLANLHPASWEPKFKDIVDLLVGWYVDEGTSVAVQRRIGDVLLMFSKQWTHAVDFGQNLLEFFIKDVHGTIEDNETSAKSKVGAISSFLSCFNVITKALINCTAHKAVKMGHIQSSGMTMLNDIGRLNMMPGVGDALDALVSDTILTLSEGSPTQMYNLQPDAIRILLRQFDGPPKSNYLWKTTVAHTKKILTMWQPTIHPMVTREVVCSTSILMRARRILPAPSRHSQDAMDIILLAIPTDGTHHSKSSHEQSRQEHYYPWEAIADEIDNILQDISTSPTTTLSGLLSNLTFDIVLLVRLAMTQNLDAQLVVHRLLNSVQRVPDMRLSVFLQAMKEISGSREHFVPEYFNGTDANKANEEHLFKSTLGHIIQVIREYFTKWKVLSNAPKMCLLAWGADILHVIQRHRSNMSGTEAWDVLKHALSSNLHQLIAMAGADDDEMIRAVIAAVFEQFIGAFGSIHLGSCLMAKMTDRSMDVSPVVGAAWRKVIFQFNPFGLALECHNIHETDFVRALKMLILKSPNSGTFRHFHFTSVLSIFGASVPTVDQKHATYDKFSQDGDVLQRLFHACQGKDILSKLNAESTRDMISWEHLAMIPNSLRMLAYWSQWEAARYCMLSRMRTPIGGPQQTFDALEKHLNALLQQEASRTISYNQRQTRLRDFLTLLNSLELQCYNASSGTALGIIPPAPRPSVVFFRTNKKVCEEWFTRIRSRFISGAKIAGEYDIVIRQSFVLLMEQFGALSRGAVGDILPWLDEFEHTLVDLVDALLAVRASDAITGLYVWCRRAIKDLIKSSSSSKSKHQRADRSNQYPRYKGACLQEGQAFALGQINLDWMNTAVLRAQYRYEHSVKDSMALMASHMDHNSDSEAEPQAEFLCRGITSTLSDLCNYSQLQGFMDSIPVNIYTNQTLPWSDDTLAQGLRDYCSDDAAQAWRHLEEYFYRDETYPSQDMLMFEQGNLSGQTFLFASKVYQQAGVQAVDIDKLCQRAFEVARPLSELLLSSGMDHARLGFVDSMVLNTPVSALPMALKEFMDFLSAVPDELKMRMLHKDLRLWVRLDAMVNLAKTQACKTDEQFRKQVNGFKFLLFKVARQYECHEFAGNIPRTWEGSLSPEVRFEEAKAAMAKHDYTTALRTSSRILEEFGRGSIQLEDPSSTAIFESKILLKLAKWSRSTKPALSAEHVKTFESILGLDHEGREYCNQTRIEAITSGCLSKAVELGAHYRKTWFAFGTHHYKQGWGILDDLGSFRLHHPVAKAANDSLRHILEVAGVEQAEMHSKNIFCVFVKHCASGQPFDEKLTYDSIRAHVAAKLSHIPELELTTEAIIDSFQVLLDRILGSYKLAVDGYFRFLQFAVLEYRCSQPLPKKITGEELTEDIDISQSAISDEITATLRLLRLLAKHGGQLYEAFHDKLADMNVEPWTNIIPQLFARLDHPEKPVQRLIANLLCKIGEQSPQLIVFHCVVGANSAHNSPIQRELLLFIGESLARSHPEMVAQVQHLIRELERITVLWEEVWCKKIMSGTAELRTTLQELTEQYNGLESIAGLGAEDKEAVMSDNYQQSVIPLLAPFESLLELHSSPETKHEKWFMSTFGPRIRAALSALGQPKAWSHLFEGLNLFKEIYNDLNKELAGTRILQLSDLSPELSSMQSSLIDIPSHISGITIQSFEQQVVVIPTKTKPKKLTLIGSDGKRYTYLFKGLEDLHLDERVMQLLRITNGMLERDKDSNARGLNARHYAVVPLSDNSGMIQWVESAVSLYTIIAKWQHRELMCARWMTDDTSAAPQGPQRATDIYHEKAAAALKKAGLLATHPRRQWPKSILLEVYHEMASETPANLLEREMWASSPTAAEWWRKTVMFARSTAVMSMIGYVIGLGDRHLDNILVDFTTGDLVHIDYNVCFEKGKRLRVPEVVPFRLTRNILTSFGVTGVEGNFRIGCEQTMKVMRKNKEILVTLLEAFVYDPLVDWQIEAPTPPSVSGQGQGQGQGRIGGTMTGGMTGGGVEGGAQELENGGNSNSSSTLTSVRSLTGSRRRLSSDSLLSTSTVGTTIGGGDSSRSLCGVESISPQQQHQQQQHQQHQAHQRNAYAVNILRRVRHKLEGRDFDAVNKFKVSEQVDRVIQEATNVENLANMYEGWTSWI